MALLLLLFLLRENFLLGNPLECGREMSSCLMEVMMAIKKTARVEKRNARPRLVLRNLRDECIMPPSGWFRTCLLLEYILSKSFSLSQGSASDISRRAGEVAGGAVFVLFLLLELMFLFLEEDFVTSMFPEMDL